MKYELQNHTEALILDLIAKAMDKSKIDKFDCSLSSELLEHGRVFVSVDGIDDSYFLITRFNAEAEGSYDFDITAGICVGDCAGMTLDMTTNFDKDSAVNQNFERLIEVLHEKD